MLEERLKASEMRAGSAAKQLAAAQNELEASNGELEMLRGRYRSERVRWGVGITAAASFATALAVGIVFAGVRSCEAELPAGARGVVTDRYHHAPYSSVVCSGRPVVCTTTYHPERWEVRVAHDGHERVDSVTEEEWNTIEEGAHR